MTTDENFNLSEKIKYGLRTAREGYSNKIIETENFESIDVVDIKEFIKRETHLINLFVDGFLDYKKFINERNKLIGKKLK